MTKHITLGSTHAAYAGYRFSPNVNAITIPAEREALELRDMEALAKTYAKGMMMGGNPSWEGDAESALMHEIAERLEENGVDRPLIATAQGTDPGDLAFGMVAKLMSWTPQFDHGQLWGFQATVGVSGRIWWGSLLADYVGTAGLTATANGTAVNEGALAAGQEAMFMLQVVDPPGITSGSTLDVTIESDVDNTFASPTTRATFTQITTAIGAEIITVDGDSTPITDTWWRAVFTVGAGPPTYYPIVMMSIRNKIS